MKEKRRLAPTKLNEQTNGKMLYRVIIVITIFFALCIVACWLRCSTVNFALALKKLFRANMIAPLCFKRFAIPMDTQQ